MQEDTTTNNPETIPSTKADVVDEIFVRPVVVFGVGGAGVNTVDILSRRMDSGAFKGSNTKLVACDTDGPKLESTFHKGSKVQTFALSRAGTGWSFNKGESAANKSLEMLRPLAVSIGKEKGMVFFVTGGGGGTCGAVRPYAQLFEELGSDVQIILILPAPLDEGFERVENAVEAIKAFWNGEKKYAVEFINNHLFVGDDLSLSEWDQRIIELSVVPTVEHNIRLCQTVFDRRNGDPEDRNKIFEGVFKNAYFGNFEFVGTLTEIAAFLSAEDSVSTMVNAVLHHPLKDNTIVSKAKRGLVNFSGPWKKGHLRKVMSEIRKQMDHGTLKETSHEGTLPKDETEKATLSISFLTAAPISEFNEKSRTRETIVLFEQLEGDDGSKTNENTGHKGNGEAAAIPIEEPPPTLVPSYVMTTSLSKGESLISINVPEASRAEWEDLKQSTEKLREIDGNHLKAAQRLRAVYQECCELQYGKSKFWVFLNAKFKRVVDDPPTTYFIVPKVTSEISSTAAQV